MACLGNQVVCKLKLGEYQQAEELATTVINWKGSSKAYLQRGQARMHLGKLQGARTDTQRALELNPRDKLIVEALRELNAKTGRQRNDTAGDWGFVKTEPEKPEIASRTAVADSDEATPATPIHVEPTPTTATAREREPACVLLGCYIQGDTPQ